MKKPLFIAAIAAAGYLVYRNLTNLVKTYTVTIGAVKFNLPATKQNLFLKAIFDINLILDNPTNFAGNLKAVKLDIIFNDRLIGTVNKTTSIKINATGQTVIPIQAGISTLTLYQNISDAITAITNRSPINLQIIGTVLTSSGSLDIKENVQVR